MSNMTPERLASFISRAVKPGYGHEACELAAELERLWALEAKVRVPEGIVPVPEFFYIQNKGFCGNCLLWWREGGHGYTMSLKDAWRLPKDEALRICRSRPDQDIPHSVHFIDGVAESHVNVEALRAALNAAGGKAWMAYSMLGKPCTSCGHRNDQDGYDPLCVNCRIKVTVTDKDALIDKLTAELDEANRKRYTQLVRCRKCGRTFIFTRLDNGDIEIINECCTRGGKAEAELATAKRELEAARADGELASLEIASLRATLAKDGAVAAWVEDLDNWVAMNLKFDSVRQCDESGHWRAETEIAEGGGRGLVEAILDVRRWHDSAPPSDAARKEPRA